MASNDSNDVAAGPLTIATLSSYSLRHLEAARPKIGPAIKVENKDHGEGVEEEGKEHTSTSGTHHRMQNKNFDKFEWFSKLPNELKDKIWKNFIEENPRKVYARFRPLIPPAPPRTPILMKINRQLRKDALGIYGYVELKNKSITLQTSRDSIDRYRFNPVIFHPEIDMLCDATSLSLRTLRTVGFLKDSLEQCKALHRLRSIAIDNYSPEDLSNLKAFPKLELVFVDLLNGLRESYEGDICRFRIAKYYGNVDWVTEAGVVSLDSYNYRQHIQEVAARGTGRITPHVESVEQDFGRDFETRDDYSGL